VHRQDLVLSTQGRAFWILDDLTPLHQLSDAVVAERAHLFKPRTAIRYHYRTGFGGPEADRGGEDAAPQYPPAGAMLDYWLASASTPVTIDILDAKGAVIRRFTSDSTRDTSSVRAGTPRLSTRAGLNRVVWDMSHPGPWSVGATGRRGGGPMAAPGRYTVRLESGGQSSTQPLDLIADPRVLKDGITRQVLDDQLAFNLQVRDLVSDANRLGVRLRELQRAAGDSAAPALREAAREFFTPAVRYSKPGLQDHITYLYGMTTGADQRVGKDARDRYRELRRRLDVLAAKVSALGTR